MFPIQLSWLSLTLGVLIKLPPLIEREVEGGAREVIELKLPAVVGAEAKGSTPLAMQASQGL